MIDLDTTTKKFLRVDEVCALLEVSRRTCYYWIESGKIPSVHIGGSYRIPVAAFRKMIAAEAPLPSYSSASVQSAQRH